MPESGCDFVIQQVDQVTNDVNIKFTFLSAQCKKINEFYRLYTGCFEVFIIALDGQEIAVEYNFVNILTFILLMWRIG
jgi:hypothetical protein